MNKAVIYTAIFGGYDKLRDPVTVSEGCDYVCMTDDASLRSKVWKTIVVPDDGTPLTLKDRKIKILPHRYFPEYRYSLYVDGNILITADALRLIDKYLENGVMALSRHRDRSCIYDEAEVCLRQRKGDRDAILSQIAKYRSAGYPAKNGLYANNVLLRKHNSPEVVKVMDDWWEEVCRESGRDQISFPFIAYKNKFSPDILEEGPYSGRGYFVKKLHKRIFPGIFWECLDAFRGYVSRQTIKL